MLFSDWLTIYYVVETESETACGRQQDGARFFAFEIVSEEGIGQFTIRGSS